MVNLHLWASGQAQGVDWNLEVVMLFAMSRVKG